ncbi:MAG: N-acetylmuramoyl-L-alanine amidase, partial [Clostridium sp.]|nr:N-acetylmuramoyl-L-alanine amidase [Clostridium sp.]
MKINKFLTPYNLNRLGDANRIKYIVIHYVGATGGAEANCRYYASKYIGASAHYYVGFSGEIWQSVEDGDIAWHCGAKSYRHPECRNSNSIGIELCVRNKGSQAADSRDWYFEDATVQAAIELTMGLMEKYGIPA